MRVMLGLAEAGFFPGWFCISPIGACPLPAKTGALFMMAAPITMVIGGPLSSELLELGGVAASGAGSGSS